MGPKGYNRKKQGERKEILSTLSDHETMIQEISSRVDTWDSFLEMFNKAFEAKDEELAKVRRERTAARRETREAARSVTMWRRFTYSILVACCIIILMLIITTTSAPAKACEIENSEAAEVIHVQLITEEDTNHE